jgi:hypothetical protein
MSEHYGPFEMFQQIHGIPDVGMTNAALIGGGLKGEMGFHLDMVGANGRLFIGVRVPRPYAEMDEAGMDENGMIPSVLVAEIFTSDEAEDEAYAWVQSDA